MNEIEKMAQGPRIVKTFGGIDMQLQAQTLLSSMNPAPYTVNQVHRHTVFVFNAGEEVYELHDPATGGGSCRPGARSSTPTCRGPTCPGWLTGSTCRRDGPIKAGHWTSPLRIDTTTHAAQVLQDDLTNSYSLLAG